MRIFKKMSCEYGGMFLLRIREFPTKNDSEKTWNVKVLLVLVAFSGGGNSALWEDVNQIIALQGGPLLVISEVVTPISNVINPVTHWI